FLVGREQGNTNVGIKFAELAKPWRQPMHADADGGGDLEIAVRALATIGQFGARRFELHEDFVCRAVQQFALLGQNQPAGMAVEKADREPLLQPPPLTRHRRLGETKLLPCVCEAAGLGSGVKHLELVPVHDRSKSPLRIPSSCYASPLRRPECKSPDL